MVSKTDLMELEIKRLTKHDFVEKQLLYAMNLPFSDVLLPICELRLTLATSMFYSRIPVVCDFECHVIGVVS